MILCCRIPDIPIAALVLHHQGEAGPGARLQDRALIIGGYPSERKSVRAASAEAMSFGVCVGMPLRQAEQLCPHALFLPADPAAEADLGRHLLAGLYALAPRVELATAGFDAGVAYVDLAGMGDLEAFAARVGEYLHRRLLSRPQLGAGSNKFVACTAAGLDHGSLRVVARGSERSFLAPLVMADHLPVDPRLVDRFRLFGLRTMSDLAALPRAAVEAQFDAEGLWALRLARGEDSRPLLPWEPPQRMEERSVLDPPVDNLEPLLFVARGMVDRLAARLREGAHAVTTTRLRLEFDDWRVVGAAGQAAAAEREIVLRLRAPMSSADDLWLPIAGLLRRQQIEHPVSCLRLRVSGFCPSATRQMDLLARRDGRLEDITRQLALLAEGHGPGLVRMPELAAAPPLLDDQRHHWIDPSERLLRRASRPRRVSRAPRGVDVGAGR